NTPTRFEARPVAVVPQVDVQRHTVDLIYELATNDQRHKFAKDQMVTVHIPVGKEGRESVVPYAAVVFDAFGGTWIYVERTAADAKFHQFERRRIEVGPTVKGGVIVRPTATPGERVVVTGAGVLFSREFHKAGPKVQGTDDGN